MSGRLLVGEVLRSSQNRDPLISDMDGHPNIHHRTASRILAPIQLSKGINPIAEVKAAGITRRPAVLIRSSPWKAGSVETPWHDEFDLKRGRVVYFGDQRVDHAVPVGGTPGNKVLQRVWASHRAVSPRERALAAPLLVFATVTRNKTPKGYVKFCGLAVIEDCEVIEQSDKGKTFPNMRYELALLDLQGEEDRLNWAWIEARGDKRLSAADALERAPRSWRRWVEGGRAVLPEVRQRPLRLEETAATSSPLAPSRPENSLIPPLADEDVARAARGERQPDLTVDHLMERLRKIRVHRREGHVSPHKALALMWAIARNARGESRLSPWPQFRQEVGDLLVEFGRPHSSPTPEYPFWHLRTSGLWDVEGLSTEQPEKVSAAAFDRSEPRAGFTDQADRLLRDPFVRSQAIAVVRETFLADFEQHRLMDRLGLAGYESASGIEKSADDQGRQGPVARRETTTYRAVRDVGLADRVKKMHADHCQVCGEQLAKRFGTYSEAAHIRGLGHPHDGPDELANLLVLCPNHHVQFDTLAIYVDPEGTVRSTSNGSRVGTLRQIPQHRISQAHLRYHRALCGRDAPASESALPAPRSMQHDEQLREAPDY
ncbi:HNH endonuclease [Streptomyces sp. NPDC085942]|uniref:HNH endonuclease n=1 Tax=Streptomyces sp. NPDC085942 TaxID=3365743 RepID=UPI0037D3AFF5